MTPRIEHLTPKKLIGVRMSMSLSNNQTAALWRKFMPRRSEIANNVSTDFISMQNYGANWNFDPKTMFEKWAVMEVSGFDHVPEGMETYELLGGRYAVFPYQGTAADAAGFMVTIFTNWLTLSGLKVDNREHFEILPATYNPTDPDATEEIWIPVI